MDVQSVWQEDWKRDRRGEWVERGVGRGCNSAPGDGGAMF